MEPAKRLEDLVTWQLACALRDAVEEIVENGSANRDFEFRDQIFESSRSGPSNVAEGFGHMRPRQFARHLRIARASIMETANHIHKGAKKHFSKSDTERLLILVKRALGAIRNLLKYLDSCPADLNWRNSHQDRTTRQEGRLHPRTGTHRQPRKIQEPRTDEPMNP